MRGQTKRGEIVRGADTGQGRECGQEREPCENQGCRGQAADWRRVWGQSHPTLVRCQILALEWAKGHEGEWEGAVSSQASSKHWFGGLAGRTGARDKGGRTKV